MSIYILDLVTHLRSTTWLPDTQILEELTEDEMPKLSPEDAQLWKDATKEYNKLKMMQHRAWQTDLSVKLKLKKAALAALPGRFT